MHGFPAWFGWMLVAMSYAPHALAGLALAGVVFVVLRRRNRK